jgi:hypothetical protein
MMRKLVFILILASLSALTYAQSPDPFTGVLWQGRITYKDSNGISHSDLYDLILASNGTCIVKITGRLNGEEAFQDADGHWSFDETFFRLDCDFPDPVFEHIPALNWVSVYQFDTLKNRFTLLIKPYPNAPGNNIRMAFHNVED